MVGVSTHGMNGSSDQSFHGGPIELFLISAMTGVTKDLKQVRLLAFLFQDVD